MVLLFYAPCYSRQTYFSSGTPSYTKKILTPLLNKDILTSFFVLTQRGQQVERVEGKQLELPEVFYDPHTSASTIAASRRFSLCLLANTEYPFFDLQILVSLFNEYFPAHPNMKKLSFAFNSYSIY